MPTITPGHRKKLTRASDAPFRGAGAPQWTLEASSKSPICNKHLSGPQRNDSVPMMTRGWLFLNSTLKVLSLERENVELQHIHPRNPPAILSIRVQTDQPPPETETQPTPCNHQSRPVSPGTPGQRPWLALRVAGAGQLLGAMALSDGMDGSIERKARNERGRPGNGPDDPLLGQRITMAAAMDEDGWVPYYCSS
ncbi:hypothetical protein FocTR4_00003256 [Fusarium oxysporum f. sp. cubense]|uniref:Uncharacterized protein n=1 Tax=Fusarium oxysporum f. sp. cubense TaxID=61366 RepID=A0A5C6T9M6_FUSOC|nr:hypothetical protein FocTR4_00003256 [Fusarium oxysporum f. sp. cubense]